MCVMKAQLILIFSHPEAYKSQAVFAALKGIVYVFVVHDVFVMIYYILTLFRSYSVVCET